MKTNQLDRIEQLLEILVNRFAPDELRKHRRDAEYLVAREEIKREALTKDEAREQTSKRIAALTQQYYPELTKHREDQHEKIRDGVQEVR